MLREGRIDGHHVCADYPVGKGERSNLRDVHLVRVVYLTSYIRCVLMKECQEYGLSVGAKRES
jgi:hypothetical protein